MATNKKIRLRKVLLIWLGLILAGLALGIVLNHWDIYLPCLFREITGLKCPGCGVTRMSLALMEMDFGRAFYYNPVVFLMLPILAIILIYLSMKYVKKGTMEMPKLMEKIIVLMIIILIIFGIVRNIG